MSVKRNEIFRKEEKMKEFQEFTSIQLLLEKLETKKTEEMLK